MRVENETKTRVWKDLSFCPEILTRNAVQESISGNPEMYFLTGEAAGCETEVVLAVVAALQKLALRLGKSSSYISVNLAVFL